MKKQIIVCLVLSLFFTTAFSQLTIIPKAGISLTTISLSDDYLDGADKPGYKIGIIVGAGLEIEANKYLAIQPELLFHQKGFKSDYSNSGVTGKGSMTLNYIELPVLVKGKFENFYVNAGPSIGFGIGGKYNSEVSFQGNTDKESGNVKFGEDPNIMDDEVYFDNVIDFGLQMGGGVKAGPLVIDIRYGLGLSNLDDEPDGFSGDWKIKNRSFQFAIGFPIPMGGK